MQQIVPNANRENTKEASAWTSWLTWKEHHKRVFPSQQQKDNIEPHTELFRFQIQSEATRASNTELHWVNERTPGFEAQVADALRRNRLERRRLGERRWAKLQGDLAMARARDAAS